MSAGITIQYLYKVCPAYSSILTVWVVAGVDRRGGGAVLGGQDLFLPLLGNPKLPKEGKTFHACA